MLTYTYRYNRIIKWFKDHPADQSKEYCETHHIIPRSCKGSNTKENLILLPGRWHYIVHCWLPFVMQEQNNYNGYRKMIRAWGLMAGMIKFKDVLKEDSIAYHELRKQYSLEVSKQMRENCHTKDSIWINNGKVNKRISKDEKISLGWKHGRTKFSRTNRDLLGKRWCYNPTTKEMRFILKEEPLPEGFVYGRINVKYNSEKLRVIKGKIGITNGIVNRYIDPTDKIPNGWVRGSKTKGRPGKKGIVYIRKVPFVPDPRMKDRRWITNGIENQFVYVEIAEQFLKNGWRSGITRHK